MISKRGFMAGGLAITGLTMASRPRADASPALRPPPGPDVKPIAPEEYAARSAKLRGLMRKDDVGALLVECGSSLRYFTGVDWPRRLLAHDGVWAAIVFATGTVHRSAVLSAPANRWMASVRRILPQRPARYHGVPCRWRRCREVS